MTTTTNDSVVNHPKHYANGVSTTVECIMFTRNMSFDLGNAFKYIWRAGHKDDFKQDLEKAMWYLRDASNYDDACNLKHLIPFIPRDDMAEWKIDALCDILNGQIEFAIEVIRAILNENPF